MTKQEIEALADDLVKLEKTVGKLQTQVAELVAWKDLSDRRAGGNQATWKDVEVDDSPLPPGQVGKAQR